MIQTKHSAQGGLALLITLLTVGVIVSATIAIIELSRLQLQLSVDSRDAEIAFAAANAAKECAQYVRTTESGAIRDNNNNNISISCLGRDVTMNRVTPSFGISGGNADDVRHYQAFISWNDGGFNRCSVIDMIMVYANTSDVTIGGSGNNSLQRVISNYRSPSTTCAAGGECTIVAASGYNAACASRTAIGVLKREVLLEF